MRKFGALQSPVDRRDWHYAKIVGTEQKFPKQYILKDRFKHPVRDQGPFGTCVGHGVAAHKEEREFVDNPDLAPRLSPLFIYTEAKKIDSFPGIEGTDIRSAMKVITNLGVCTEAKHPYNKLKDVFKLPEPSQDAKDEALTFRNQAYAQVTTLDEFKSAMMRDGALPFAILVTENFFDVSQDGNLQMPDGRYLGAHCMCAVGWDDERTGKSKSYIGTVQYHKGYILVLNSHGEEYGDHGYLWIPYDFFNGRMLDTGIPYWLETWSGVDIMTPPKSAEVIELWVDKDFALVDGKEVFLDQPVIINAKTSRTLVPLRFLAENFGYNVTWEASIRKITLRKKG